jgi:hypothetical protein
MSALAEITEAAIKTADAVAAKKERILDELEGRLMGIKTTPPISTNATDFFS